MGNGKILIRIRQNEAYLARWVELVREQETRGLMTYLLRQIMLHYIRYGEIICIGKIHYSLEEYAERNRTIVLTAYIQDCPEIQEWIDENVRYGNTKNSTLVRDILKRAVQVVADDQPEWIPSFFDIDVINRKSSGLTRINTHFDEGMPSAVAVPREHFESGILSQKPSGGVGVTERESGHESVEINPAPSVRASGSEEDRASDTQLPHRDADIHNQEIMGTGFRRKRKKT